MKTKKIDKPAHDTEVEKLEEESNELVLRAQNFPITNDDEYELAGGFLVDIKSYQKKVVDHHKEMKSKAYDVWKEICRAESSLLDPAKRAESVIKTAMGRFLREREEKQRKLAAVQQAKERAAEKAGREKPEPSPVIRERPKPTGVRVSKVWKFEIIDIDKVNRDFMVVDQQSVRQVVNLLGDKAEESIGKGSIKIWQEDQIGGRG